MTKNIYIESLLSLGGKKRKGSIDFVADNLLIRHKDSRIEYTVKKIIKDEVVNPNFISAELCLNITPWRATATHFAYLCAL